MKNIYLFVFSVLFVVAGASVASAATPEWDMTGSYGIDLTCVSGCGGTYAHTMNVTLMDTGTGVFSGTGFYDADLSYTWDVDGVVSGWELGFSVVYTGTNAGYGFTATGAISEDGSLSGNATSTTGQVFTFLSTSGAATYLTWGEIIEPEENEIVIGMTDLVAKYYDESPGTNDDAVNWAVRKGTCDAGINTVAGNVDTYNDQYNWDGMNFDAVIDTTGWDGGQYCFIFNPTDDPGQNDVRETRLFYVAEHMVNGGGHLLEENGKRKNWLDVSLGGWFADIGTLVGDWTIQLHNVGGTNLDKGTFHSTTIDSYNWYGGDSPTCNDAMNVTMHGTFNGEDGYKVILRAGDFGSPNTVDTIRVEIFNTSNVKIYDTNGWGEFTHSSTCVGTARTGLDTGNITLQ